MTNDTLLKVVQDVCQDAGCVLIPKTPDATNAVLRGIVDQRDRAVEALTFAMVYIERYVSVEDALVDGFDVEAWCQALEQLGLASTPAPKGEDG